MFTGVGYCYKCSNCDCRQGFFHFPNHFHPTTTVNSNNNNNTTSYRGSSSHSSYYCHPMGPKSAQNGPGSGSGGRRSNVVACGNYREEKRLVTRKSCPSMNGHQQQQHHAHGQPFRNFCGEAPRMFTAPAIVPRKNTPITSTVRNYDSGGIRNFVAVPQAVQLYDDNPFNDIRISREEFEKLVSRAYSTTTANLEAYSGRKCTELDEPKINSMKRSVKEMQRAIGNLQKIPREVEKKALQDPVLHRKIMEQVTKKMNIPTKSKLYQNLIPVETPEVEKARSAEEILKGLKSIQPPLKAKDPEPSILAFNQPTFSRVKPKLPDPPPKPSQGVSTTLNEDYQLILSEHEFNEKGSNASLFQKQLSEPVLSD